MCLIIIISGVAPQLIPYRTSKITHIFRDVLHGKGRIMLAVHVSPDECDYSETQHMLEYARAATEIKTVHMPLAPQTVVHASIAVTPSTLLRLVPAKLAACMYTTPLLHGSRGK